MTVSRIGNASVDFDQLTIEGDAGQFSVEPKVLEVLQYLIAHHGEVIEREALIDHVWGVSYGGDERLSRAISLLRKALGDNARNHRYIQTIPKRGYRLVAEVQEAKPAVADDLAAGPQPRPKRSPLSLTVIGLVLSIAVGFAVLVNWDRAASSSAANDVNSSALSVGVGDIRNSIAVLPFNDLSEAADQRYLADGLAEELINAITQFPNVRVVGQTSSFRFRDEGADPRSVGETLNVRYVLTGAVRKQRDALRVSAQLVSTDDSAVLWSDTYDGDYDRLLDFQEDIARAIAGELDVAIGSSARLVQELTVSQEAYDLFVQGRYLSRRFGRENKLSALRLLEQAVAIDPDFASAWAWIGRTQMLQAIAEPKTEQDRLVSEARIAVRRALALNPDLAVTNYVQALLFDYDLDLAASQDAMERAYQADPNQPLMINRRGTYFANIGLTDKAEALLSDGIQRDPTDAVALLNLGRARSVRSDFAGALELVERSVDLQFMPAAGWRCIMLAYLEQEDEVTACWEDLPVQFKQRYEPPFSGPQAWTQLGQGYLGENERARVQALDVLNRHFGQEGATANAYLTGIYIGLGAPDLFMERFLARPFPANGNGMASIWMPGEQPAALRQHPDFPGFAVRIGLVRAWEKYGWPEQCQRLPDHTPERPRFSCF